MQLIYSPIEMGIGQLRQETQAGIERRRQETKTDITKVEMRMETIKSDLMKWLIGAMIAHGGVVVGLIRLLVLPGDTVDAVR